MQETHTERSMCVTNMLPWAVLEACVYVDMFVVFTLRMSMRVGVGMNRHPGCLPDRPAADQHQRQADDKFRPEAQCLYRYCLFSQYRQPADGRNTESMPEPPNETDTGGPRPVYRRNRRQCNQVIRSGHNV
jgi:hypothetical protein